MINAELVYFDLVRETRRYDNGVYYEHQESKIVRNETIEGETDIEIFEKFYKKNNQLRYCNGCYYQFATNEWDLKYKDWLKSDDYEAKSFNLYYGNGVVD